MIIERKTYDSLAIPPPTGRDANLFYRHGDRDGNYIMADQCRFNIRPEHVSLFAESAKISTTADVLFNRCHLYGGTEDCVDIIRCGRLFFTECWFYARPETLRHVTIKTGGINAIFDTCHFVGKTRSGYCVQAGDYSAYNQIRRPAHRGGYFYNCENVDGNRLARLLYSDGWSQEQTHGDATIRTIPRPLVAILFWLRRKAIIGAKRETFTPEQIALRPWEL